MGRWHHTFDRTVDTLAQHLVAMLTTAWSYGWMPADVVRVAERAGRAHGQLAAAAILAEHANRNLTVHPRWQSQLDELAASVGWRGGDGLTSWFRDRSSVAVGVELRDMLAGLPRLPPICQPPGATAWSARAPADVDAVAMRRIRALLAKAERTTFAHEAEAFTAKAQQLMADHSVNHAMLDGAEGDEPVATRIAVDAPYADGKSILLAEVAHANRCEAVWAKELGFSTVFGFDVDLAAVELLYTSLLVQAAAALTTHGAVRDGAGRSRTRSFRQAFYLGFATRIGQRLRAVTDAAAEAAAADHGEAVLPVLASRSERVEAAAAEAFPNVVRRFSTWSNRNGWAAGGVAADLAHLGPDVDALADPA